MSENGGGEVRNPAFARLHAHFLEPLTARDANRDRLLADISGRVLELGCGAGVNFSYYAPTASEVVAIEPEPYLRARAERAALSAAVDVRVIDGNSESLPLPDASFDAAVCSLVLCSVPDLAQTLAELRRVLRPGGRLHYYEHVVSRNRVVRGVQRAVDTTFWPRLFGNCHPARDTEAAIVAAGFEIEHTHRITGIAPPFPHVLGVARRL
jgi:ubiquinone/menaquinone biosynthesis C-methylase UbiE